MGFSGIFLTKVPIIWGFGMWVISQTFDQKKIPEAGDEKRVDAVTPKID